MPLLNKEQIPPAIRNHYMQEYRRKLLERLAIPGLPDEQKDAIKVQVAGLGKPKPYRKAS